ncbi:MAG: hypothetical protein ACI8Y4_004228 [Candidatus Poriferisodalaceae bacterium]|jgi:hypothetical protein
MAYRTAELPPVELDEFAKIPFMERMKLLQLHWVEAGFGTPKQTGVFYAWKIFFYALFGLIVAGAFTAGLEFNDIGGWWDEPILYQKLMVWTILLEVLGLAATCGPLAFHFDPPIGGVLYWWQTDTLRVPPYPNHVPLTKGDRRTPWDTGLYKLIIFWLVMMLFLSGDPIAGLPDGRAGVLPQWSLIVYAGLIITMGFRDKIIFLSSRAEQYVPTMLAFGLFTNFVDMVIAAKIFIVVIWMGAGFSKFNHGFSSTVAIMVQNTPWVIWPKFKKATVKDFPNDIRPSRTTHLLAHIGGSTTELMMPLVLLFSPWGWATWIAVIAIWMLHTFIISTFPLAVPLEWNVFFIFCVAFLFINFHASEGYGVQDMNPGLLALVVFVALFPIVLGALRPQYVSFLVGMKQYAGNWAAATFSLRNKEIEDRINQKIVKAADNQIDQIEPLFGKEISEVFIQKAVAFRMMHPMGRMHISGLMCHVDSLDNRVQREGEFLSNVLTGWNFGDGHCLDERLIAAWQDRCQYDPGDVIAVFTESQPAFTKIVQYRVIDAALGCVEKGWYHNDDAYNTQPWLPDGPIPHTVTWRQDGYEPQGMAHPGDARKEQSIDKNGKWLIPRAGADVDVATAD